MNELYKFFFHQKNIHPDFKISYKEEAPPLSKRNIEKNQQKNGIKKITSYMYGAHTLQ